jgi:aldehyde reductase
VKALNLFEEPVIKQLATKYGKTAGQIVLNWHVKHRNHIIIPKTTKVERLSENFQVYDFSLTSEEYESISALNRNARFYNFKYLKEYGFNNIPYFD